MKDAQLCCTYKNHDLHQAPLKCPACNNTKASPTVERQNRLPVLTAHLERCLAKADARKEGKWTGL